MPPQEYPQAIEPEDDPYFGNHETILGNEWVEQQVRSKPSICDGERLEKLHPEESLEDRIMAEFIITRDRLLGILHPELVGKLTAKM